MIKHVLYGRRGWGSVLVESQLHWYGLDYDFSEVGDLFESAAARAELAQVNPLAQVPTLVLPDGSVMTESAAITLYLADLAQAQSNAPSLVPLEPGPVRNRFLRWLVYLVANVYPTFTYADDPSRFVGVAEARKPFAKAVGAYAQDRYRELEASAQSPWFLGETFSALDLYLCTLVRWRPGPQWFKEESTRLYDIAKAVDQLESLQPVWRANFNRPKDQLA